MEKAKAHVKEFIGRKGHHDTSVHEHEAPAVQHETVKPTHHENVMPAVDREVHQHHYHQTEQPVQDREVLPEQHHHRLGQVEERVFDHRDEGADKKHLEFEAAKYKDEKVVEDTQHTQSQQPTIGGEHVHHHVHETIQPVIHKETIQPHVTHTTKPIHEVHHESAHHHGTSTLAPISMSEYKNGGGALGGERERHAHHEGLPVKQGGIESALHHGHNEHHAHHDHHDHHERTSHESHEKPSLLQRIVS